MLVYCATNAVNGMQYVGVTVKKLKYRANGHKRDAERGKGSENSLQNAIRLHGFNSISFEKIDLAQDYAELREKEMFWISNLNTLWPHGYNLNKGGNLHGEIKNRRYKHEFTVEGVTYHGMGALGAAYGLTRKTIECRLYSNLCWTLRQVVGLDPAPVQVPVCAKEITYKGVTYASRRHLARALNPNISTETFRHRLERGMSIEDALSDEGLIGNASEVVIDGKKFESISAAARHYGIKTSTMANRIRSGWASSKCASETLRIQPITVNGVTYKNKVELFSALDIDYDYFVRRMHYGLSAEQVVNKEKTEYEKNLEFTVDGKVFVSKKEAAKYYGVKPIEISKRLLRGWTPEEAVELVERITKKQGRKVTVEGRTFKSVLVASEHYGVDVMEARRRIHSGWSPEEVFGLKQRSKRRPHKGKPIVVDGLKFPSLSEAAEHYGVNKGTASSRVKLGWTSEQVFDVHPKPKRIYNRCSTTGRLLRKEA